MRNERVIQKAAGLLYQGQLCICISAEAIDSHNCLSEMWQTAFNLSFVDSIQSLPKEKYLEPIDLAAT